MAIFCKSIKKQFIFLQNITRDVLRTTHTTLRNVILHSKISLLGLKKLILQQCNFLQI